MKNKPLSSKLSKANFFYRTREPDISHLRQNWVSQWYLSCHKVSWVRHILKGYRFFYEHNCHKCHNHRQNMIFCYVHCLEYLLLERGNLCHHIGSLGQNPERKNRLGLNRTGHMSFLTGQDRTPKFAKQVIPDLTKSGLLILYFFNFK